MRKYDDTYIYGIEKQQGNEIWCEIFGRRTRSIRGGKPECHVRHFFGSSPRCRPKFLIFVQRCWGCSNNVHQVKKKCVGTRYA
jgi:hypothetical protein